MKQTFILNGIDILKQVEELKQENYQLKAYVSELEKGNIQLQEELKQKLEKNKKDSRSNFV